MKLQSGVLAPCPGCGSSRIVVERMTSGPHFGRLVCRDCGRQLKWLARPVPTAGPGPPPPALVDEGYRSRRPAQLHGSPKQIEWALKIRFDMIRRERDPDRQAALYAIDDAAWFIASRDGIKNWPTPE